ncbi:hypothetical protein [Thioalkalivibrio sp. ALJ24]|uniref:hypothetical protein n=1 Tax=Thioalkalivibrio sp. ALJ24 TaxID=545276 RepID=UPI000362D6E8|nr:hypothetical protein [Thioalkalivibrio sp. ALJ24]
MISRLSAWITARSVPSAGIGRTVIIAPRRELEAAGEWLSELQQAIGPLLLGVSDAARDAEARIPGLPDDLPALALSGELAPARLSRLRPRALVLLGPCELTGTALNGPRVPVAWVNATGPAPEGVTFATVLAARDGSAPAELDAETVGDPVAGPVELPEIETPDHDFCERFDEYRQRGHPILLAPNTGPGEEAFAFAVLFAVLRRTAALLLLAPADPDRHEPVYRDAIKYSLPIVRHNRFMTSFVPRKNRVYYIEDPQTLEMAYACADVTLPGGTLAATGTPPDLARPLASGSAIVTGPAASGESAQTEARLRRAAEVTGLIRRGEDPEAVAAAILATVKAGSVTDPDTPADRLSAWQQRQAEARDRVAAHLRKALDISGPEEAL